MPGLIGKKVGMTQLFTEDGQAVPVTAIEAGPCPIVQVRTEARDGYRAVQLGFGRKKERWVRRPERGHVDGAALDHVPAVLHEFRLGEEDRLAEDPHTPARAPAAVAADASDASDEAEAESPSGASAEAAESAEPAESDGGESEGFRVGQTLTVEIFQPGDRVKVTGRTKGRGFQGVVKRHGFSGRPKSHGHPSVRVPGSIGPGTDPSRVIKGRKMAGQMGNERRTVRNLEIVRVDPERNLVFIKGSVPGARNGYLFIGRQ